MRLFTPEIACMKVLVLQAWVESVIILSKYYWVYFYGISNASHVSFLFFIVSELSWFIISFNSSILVFLSNTGDDRTLITIFHFSVILGFPSLFVSLSSEPLYHLYNLIIPYLLSASVKAIILSFITISLFLFLFLSLLSYYTHFYNSFLLHSLRYYLGKYF